MIWIIGEYAERIDNADELLEQFLETFPEETSLVSIYVHHIVPSRLAQLCQAHLGPILLLETGHMLRLHDSRAKCTESGMYETQHQDEHLLIA